MDGTRSSSRRTVWAAPSTKPVARTAFMILLRTVSTTSHSRLYCAM